MGAQQRGRVLRVLMAPPPWPQVLFLFGAKPRACGFCFLWGLRLVPLTQGGPESRLGVKGSGSVACRWASPRRRGAADGPLQEEATATLGAQALPCWAYPGPPAVLGPPHSHPGLLTPTPQCSGQHLVLGLGLGATTLTVSTFLWAHLPW